MKTSLEAEGGDPLGRLRRMLDAADIDPESIHRVSVTVEHNGTDGEAVETDALVERAREEAEARAERAAEDAPGESPEERVEYGPSGSDPDAKPRGRGGGGGGYEGDLPNNLFEGEAIRPDSNQGRALAAVEELGWTHCHEVSEETDMAVSTASQSLSHLFKRTGWLKRRKIEEPGQRGPRFEYHTTQAGRGALREGRRIAEEYRAERREQQEAEMDSGN